MEVFLLIVIVAIYLGFALWMIRWAWVNPQASGWRIFNYVAGGSILLSCLGAPIVLFPVFQSARYAANYTACLSNLTGIGRALQMYMEDNDRTPRSAWCDALGGYLVEGSFACPKLNRPFGYTMNDMLVGIDPKLIADPAKTVFAFDGVGVKNSVGDADDIRWRHNDAATVVCFDGHARLINNQGHNLFFAPFKK